VDAVSACPTTGVPEMAGGAVFAGGDGGGGVGDGAGPVDVGGAATTDVAAEVAAELPNGLVAETVPRIVAPTSAEATVYVVSTAPSTATQFPPDESQRFHE
jgi:hypothetical protein